MRQHAGSTLAAVLMAAWTQSASGGVAATGGYGKGPDQAVSLLNNLLEYNQAIKRE